MDTAPKSETEKIKKNMKEKQRNEKEELKKR